MVRCKNWAKSTSHDGRLSAMSLEFVQVVFRAYKNWYNNASSYIQNYFDSPSDAESKITHVWQMCLCQKTLLGSLDSQKHHFLTSQCTKLHNTTGQKSRAVTFTSSLISQCVHNKPINTLVPWTCSDNHVWLRWGGSGSKIIAHLYLSMRFENTVAKWIFTFITSLMALNVCNKLMHEIDVSKHRITSMHAHNTHFGVIFGTNILCWKLFLWSCEPECDISSD